MYAARFGARLPSQWTFLTGPNPEAIRQMIQEGFKLTVVPMPAGPIGGPHGYQISHSSRLALVDRQGRVRGTYDATDPAALDSLRAHLGVLLH